MAITLKAVNAELAKRVVRLERAGGYFYFMGGEAATWLQKTVIVPTIKSLTVEQWLGEFERLKKLNSQIMKRPPNSSPTKRPAKKSAS